MFDNIIAYSVRNKLVVGLFVLALIAWGIFSLRQIPIDAVPDITNNQVQVITSSPTLATQEVEQFITTPVELALQNLQDLVEIRSISRFGLSVVTVVFEESTDTYLARQLVSEHLREAEENIPPGLGAPEMAPISTGLGEIYQYVVRPESGYEDQYSPTDLRSIQDWIVSRQLSGIEGVVEVNTMGGFLKQYEVAVDPELLKSVGVTINDVFAALENSNENTGGAYIEKNPRTYYIRTNGIVTSLDDIRKIVVDVRAGRPILIEDVGTVQFGRAPRYGALVRNGEEAVGGRVMMLKGANSAAVTERVKERVIQIQKSLPEGVVIEPYLVRDKLVSTAIGTVQKNLLEGGLIVLFILILLLGNWRAGLIVASVIPLAMLFAISMMNLLGISANLMSLGAIDFGLIVDGAVIIVESIVHRLQVRFAGQKISQAQMDGEVTDSSIKIRSSAAFGEIIILMVYIPILALVGIEGKMFRPMAQTVMLAIAGALILSLTYVPAMSALFLNKKVMNKRTIADRIIGFFQWLYAPVLNAALRFKTVFVLATVALFAVSIFVFSRMGGEFIPTLEEGDLAMQQIMPPGTSLSQSIEMTKKVQDKLLADFPEMLEVVTNIGAAEIPTDPMPVEIGDYTIVMKPKEEWTTASNRQTMFEAIEKSLEVFPGLGLEFSQPIQLRFNELMTGAKADIAIKLYGADLDVAFQKAKEAERIISGIPGAGTVTVEQTIGMPQILVDFNYPKMAQYGLQTRDVNRVIETAFAGATAGTVYEGERRYDLTVRLQEGNRAGISDVRNLFIPLENGSQVPLREVASVELVDAPMQISRENTNRRIVIGVNVGDSDVETLVGNIQSALDENIDLPAGYYFTYGGQFENLQAASARLSIAVPVALALIFILLFFTFGSFSQAALIFVAIPLSAIGGILALELRGMPFSISAGIGFIALFGVAVLNGIVLIGYFNQLKTEGWDDVRARIIEGTTVRLRPVIMTASVASLGFLPMALSTSGGAEVQRPLATVVIGGLLTATFLTLIILPILYSWLEGWKNRRSGVSKVAVLIPLLLCSFWARAQVQGELEEQGDPTPMTLNEAVNLAITRNPIVTAANQLTEQNRSLQNLPYSPGNTDISYQGDGLFRENGQRVNQFAVVQQFAHPAGIRATNAVQDAIVRSNEISGRLTEAELALEVSNRYYELQQREASLRLYERLTATYAEYYRTALIRAETGEANRLEALNLSSRLREQELLAQRARLSVASLRQRLGVLIGADGDVTARDTLSQIALPFSIDTSINTLAVQLAEQDIAFTRANIGRTRAELKPGFRLGYSAQHYFEGGYLSGIEAGITLPLFNKSTKRRIEAQQLGVAVAESQLEATRLRRRSEQLEASNQLREIEASLTFYREQLAVVNPEIVRISRLNYRAGEITYLELLSALEMLADNNIGYLESLLAYNQTVARIQFLNQ
ncbi:CusA/CzcA family heavy metal efflux RND transporter [Neolewinella aurantiaca]|uniref:CusA/CzcA family heavy metal efflux RND transporter n=1 Tax=Neolewinella aurantiaca TaxID=2602767 RepID=A0A5C7FFZ7_9BACT|nr:CusA/CzcA family heavy metal efflux RND transporter [Neolewinella aurantiaca]TXF89276.1 CusA/CzcA family heavy metal efflux RND transporter [Neolewinella aurantiaca]